MRVRTLVVAFVLFFPSQALAAESSYSSSGFEAPDSLRLLSLNEQLRARRLVRVEIDEGVRIDLYRPRATKEGLSYNAFMFREGITYLTPYDPRAPKLDWSRVHSIEARGHGTAVGLLIGLALGVAVGRRMANSIRCDENIFAVVACEESRIFPWLVMPILGAGLGAGIGSNIDPWRRLYP